MSKIYNRIVHEYKCLFLAFILFQLRERVVTKFGCNGRMSQSYLSYFLTGFHWRISLLSRANRLCTVFNAGLKDLGVLHVSVSLFVFSPE